MTTNKVLATILTATALFNAADAMQQIPTMQTNDSGAHVAQATKRSHLRWTPEEDALLIQKVEEFKTDSRIQWTKIAKFFPNRRLNYVRQHWRDVLQYLQYDAIKYSKWTPEEDALLIQKVEEFKTDSRIQWTKIAKFFPNRRPRAVQEHWRDVLQYDAIKYSWWTPAEDDLLREKVQELGTTWIKIVKFFPNRNVSQISGHWHHTLSKRCAPGVENGANPAHTTSRPNDVANDSTFDVLVNPSEDSDLKDFRFEDFLYEDSDLTDSEVDACAPSDGF